MFTLAVSNWVAWVEKSLTSRTIRGKHRDNSSQANSDQITTLSPVPFGCSPRCSTTGPGTGTTTLGISRQNCAPWLVRLCRRSIRAFPISTIYNTCASLFHDLLSSGVSHDSSFLGLCQCYKLHISMLNKVYSILTKSVVYASVSGQFGQDYHRLESFSKSTLLMFLIFSFTCIVFVTIRFTISCPREDAAGLSREHVLCIPSKS